MKTTLSRRGFLGGSAAFFVAGCRTTDFFGTPELQFGVLSDIHITTPESAALTEKAFAWLKERGADAVMMPGDLTDWGLCRSLDYLKASWDRVFAGTATVPLFCTGNHDYDGWEYGDMTMEMHANGYSESDALIKRGLPAYWEKTFGEPFAPVRVRTVKGYDFVSAEWGAAAQVPAFMAANRARFSGTKPFFFFQHPPISGTTGDAGRDGSKDPVFTALKPFANAVTFTGHTHWTFNDERLIWQGDFTAVATPSLSYVGTPGGFENGSGRRNGTAYQTMPFPTFRRDLRGGQGYYVSVYTDKMVIARIDFEEGGVEGAGAWVVPLGARAKPYAFAPRAAASVAPEFPAGATFCTETRNTENRVGKWTIAMNCEFSSAVPPRGERVHSYEIRAVPKDGSAPLVKRFITPGYARLAKYETERVRVWFDVAELPQDKEYVLEVYACNCWGKMSRPLVSRVWKSVPGLAKAVK